MFEEVKTALSSLKGQNLSLLILYFSLSVKSAGGKKVVNNRWEQTGYHFEHNIFHFLSASLLSLPLLLPLRLLLDLFDWECLLRLQQFLKCLCRNINIFQINISRMLKGIQFAHGSLHLIVEFMRTNTLQDAVIVISQDNITLGVQLQDEMVGERLRTKRNDNNTLDTHLTHTDHSFRSQEFPEAHGETRWNGLFIRLLFGEMEANSVFDQKMTFLL